MHIIEFNGNVFVAERGKDGQSWIIAVFSESDSEYLRPSSAPFDKAMARAERFIRVSDKMTKITDIAREAVELHRADYAGTERWVMELEELEERLTEWCEETGITEGDSK